MDLKTLRKQKKLTQTELAKFMQVNQTLISKYENQKAQPSLNTTLKLAKVLDVDVATILACFYSEPKEIEI